MVTGTHHGTGGGGGGGGGSSSSSRVQFLFIKALTQQLGGPVTASVQTYETLIVEQCDRNMRTKTTKEQCYQATDYVTNTWGKLMIILQKLM
jgi:hypothetical protein